MRFRGLVAVTAPLLVACVACGKYTVDPPPATAGATEVVVGDPVTAAPIATPPKVEWAPEPTSAQGAPFESDPSAEPLPATWTGPIVPGLSFDEALKKARDAREAHGRLVVPGANDKPDVVKAWFARAQALVDQASRMYAAAFHAPDAPREGRIDAIAEAAELDMMMMRSLDDAGLGSLPIAWRADPALASTFEDIAVGPTRRWRDEARVLARQCIDTARETNVLTDAARRCAAIRTGAPSKRAKRGTDAGAPCACAPGDPLCSASLGGWCPPR
jgi:hypothetical protein